MNDDDIIHNDVVRFIKITRKKDGMFAHFRVKGIKGGSVFNTTIDVDLAAAEVEASDPLEKIIDHCAKLAIKECQRRDLRFEGLAAI
jgi:hypothetical protein